MHERGWFGGAYKLAKPRATFANWVSGGANILYCFPPELEKTQKTGIVVLELTTNSPAYRAGLREADLILELNHQPVLGFHGFWETVWAAKPGSLVPVKYYRDGKVMECEVKVGREKFRHQGTVMVGLPPVLEHPHLIPTRDNPSVSLVALGLSQSDDAPYNLDSPEEHYRHACHPKEEQKAWDQDWRFWLAIFQVTRSKSILAQEPVE